MPFCFGLIGFLFTSKHHEYGVSFCSTATAVGAASTLFSHGSRDYISSGGQQLPAGNNLTISGISKINTTSSNCHVFVILNGIRPYQKVLPVDQNLSSSAYSNWRYTIDPATYSASIKEGNNKITAKMLCEGNPVSIKKFYSVNVTGVNGTLPELVTANSNASAASSVLPMSSKISVANQSSSDPTNNANPNSSSDTTSSTVHHHHSSGHQKNGNDKGTGNSSNYKKQSSPTNHQGKGSDFAHSIITSIERRLGI